ncbi:MAG: hypothetical protein V1862_02460 [Methanobacteriota archaeon]
MTEHAKNWLHRSYTICSSIGIKDQYSDAELDDLEALTSRFSRASDILIQQVYRAIDEVELEQGGTVLDRLNRAEKRGLVDSVTEVRAIRELRNTISHEDELADLIELFHDTLSMTPSLLQLIDRAEKYCHIKYKSGDED